MRSFLLISAALLFLSPQAAHPAPQATHTQRAQPASTIHGNLEHGRYIVHDIAMCVECHSTRDQEGNILESREFAGGPIPFSPPWPNDWAIYAPRNKGLAGYDDAQALRLLMEGAIGRDGLPLKLPMPRFHMSRQDAEDVITYMRSLQ